jgi:hypothetical protein
MLLLAGLLTCSRFERLPDFGQWLFARIVVGTYSSEDCPGFAPEFPFKQYLLSIAPKALAKVIGFEYQGSRLIKK